MQTNASQATLHHNQSLDYQSSIPLQSYYQKSVETSRFLDDPAAKNTKKRGVSLKPYEALINQVAHKIDLIEQDLSRIDSTDKKSEEQEAFLGLKQRELLALKNEHDLLVRTIRERSEKRAQ